MIRSADKLLELLQTGETVSEQANLTERGFRLATTLTNETCSRGALKALMRRGEVVAVAFDIGGAPYQWGRA